MKAPENWKWQFLAEVTNIVDGDTFDVKLDRGFRDASVKRLRLHGIDTEEMNDKDPARLDRAVKARDILQEELLNRLIILETFRVKEEIFGKERTTFDRFEAKVIRADDGWDPVEVLKQSGLEKLPR